jgi:endonuclease/exonuclease/phosphatase family metal-dependent hydrolase
LNFDSPFKVKEVSALNLNLIRSNILRYWYLWVFEGFSIFCYLSVWIPPTTFWPAVIGSYSIPVVLMINAFLIIVLPLIKLRLIVFPLMALFIGIPFLQVTYSNKGSTTAKLNHDLSILSFNAKFFRKRKTYGEFSYEMIRWAAEDTSDIKCFQEYSTNERWPVLDITRQIKEQGYNGFVYAADMDDDEHSPGMAIYSRHEIVDSGFVWKNYNTFHSGIFADVKIGGDTIRIYNVHLASMHLRLFEYKDPSNYWGKIKYLIWTLKNSAKVRSGQIDKLLSHIEQSPYPYIICGDFNETPYSYNYFRLKKNFLNAFEKAGHGFGFTFNSVVFFLRIDHQFYGPDFQAVHFHVDRNMKISDHFPVRGYYRF